MAFTDRSIGSETAVGTASQSLRDLELELVRVRKEARAARLEARAAEIEQRVRRLRNAVESADGVRRPAAPAGNVLTETSPTNVSACNPGPPFVGKVPEEETPTAPPFASGWEELELAAKQRRTSSSDSSVSSAIDVPLPVDVPSPIDGPSPLASGSDPPTLPENRKEKNKKAAKRHTGEPKIDAERPTSRRLSHLPGRLPEERRSSPPGLPSQGLALSDDDPPVAKRRRRPVAWFMSTLMHIVVLLLLAALTLRAPDPQDQLAFSASALPAASEELESLTIEPMESVDEPSERAPMDEAVEIDPLGDADAAPPVSVQPPAASAPAEAMSINDSFDTSELLLPSDTEVTTEFCGVAGGGNHFCYIVDSSLSMKNGRFDSARAELLQSIEQLKDDQRFYVIFYDTNVDRMCIGDPALPDPHSANATSKNKRALRRWAMQIGLERGAPPDKALEFAFTLRPDVIFLLSDGEFPQRIERLVAELNRKDNLFGDEGPRSILHTIGYHSREGETRMRRLAEANGGQYHYVPKP